MNIEFLRRRGFVCRSPERMSWKRTSSSRLYFLILLGSVALVYNELQRLKFQLKLPSMIYFFIYYYCGCCCCCYCLWRAIFVERGFFFKNRVQKLENSLRKNGIFFNDRAIFDESKDEWFMYMCIMARIIENCAIDGAKYQIDIRMNVKMKNLYTYMYNTRIVGKLCNRHFTVK